MRLVSVVLGVLLTVLTPLVHGSPIDPSTPGFWDDGDYDDVILLLSSQLHPIAPVDPNPSPPSASVVGDVTEQPQPPLAPRSYATAVPRAPPSA